MIKLQEKNEKLKNESYISVENKVDKIASKGYKTKKNLVKIN